MRIVILTGDPANTPARHLLAALLQGAMPPAAVLIDPPPPPRTATPAPGALARYAWFLRVGGPGYVWRKLRAARTRRLRAAGALAAQEPPLLTTQCAAAGIDCLTLGNINTPPHLDVLRQLAPDVLVMLGCRILQPPVLDCARLALNFHCGRLPDFRGSDSIYWALAAGRPDAVGYTIHQATAALDAGAVYVEDTVSPRPGDLLEDLFDRCIAQATPQWVELLRQLAAGTPPRPLKALDAAAGSLYRAAPWRDRARLEARLLRTGR